MPKWKKEWDTDFAKLMRGEYDRKSDPPKAPPDEDFEVIISLAALRQMEIANFVMLETVKSLAKDNKRNRRAFHVASVIAGFLAVVGLAALLGWRTQ